MQDSLQEEICSHRSQSSMRVAILGVTLLYFCMLRYSSESSLRRADDNQKPRPSLAKPKLDPPHERVQNHLRAPATSIPSSIEDSTKVRSTTSMVANELSKVRDKVEDMPVKQKKILVKKQQTPKPQNQQINNFSSTPDPVKLADNTTKTSSIPNQIESSVYQSEIQSLAHQDLDGRPTASSILPWYAETSNLLPLDWQLFPHQDNQMINFEAPHQSYVIPQPAIDQFPVQSFAGSPFKELQSIKNRRKITTPYRLIGKLKRRFSLKNLFPIPPSWQRKIWWTTTRPKFGSRAQVTRRTQLDTREQAYITPVDFVFPLPFVPRSNLNTKFRHRFGSLDQFSDYSKFLNSDVGGLTSRDVFNGLDSNNLPSIPAPSNSYSPDFLYSDDLKPHDLAAVGAFMNPRPARVRIINKPKTPDKELVDMFERAISVVMRDQMQPNHAGTGDLAPSTNTLPHTNPYVSSRNVTSRLINSASTISKQRMKQPLAYMSPDGKRIYFNGSVPPRDIDDFMPLYGPVAIVRKRKKGKKVKLSPATDLEASNTIHHLSHLYGDEDDDDDDDDDGTDVNVNLRGFRVSRSGRQPNTASLLVSLAFLLLSNVSLAATVIAHGISALLGFDSSHDSSHSSQFGMGLGSSTNSGFSSGFGSSSSLSSGHGYCQSFFGRRLFCRMRSSTTRRPGKIGRSEEPNDASAASITGKEEEKVTNSTLALVEANRATVKAQPPATEVT